MASHQDPGTSAVARNLKSFRELRALTQAQLGERAGIAAAAISHFETGQRMPSLESLVRLADALEVSMDVLLGRPAATAQIEVPAVFLRAARASASTLDAAKRVVEALLQAEKA